MGDDIEFKKVEVIQGGLLQIDIFDKSLGKGFRCFVDPVTFFSQLGISMNTHMLDWMQAYHDEMKDKG